MAKTYNLQLTTEDDGSVTTVISHGNDQVATRVFRNDEGGISLTLEQAGQAPHTQALTDQKSFGHAVEANAYQALLLTLKAVSKNYERDFKGRFVSPELCPWCGALHPEDIAKAIDDLLATANTSETEEPSVGAD